MSKRLDIDDAMRNDKASRNERRTLMERFDDWYYVYGGRESLYSFAEKAILVFLLGSFCLIAWWVI